MKRFFLTLSGLAISLLARGQHIIPQPAEITFAAGIYSFSETPTIIADQALRAEMAYLSDYLSAAFGVQLKSAHGGTADIQLVENPADSVTLGKEGYSLQVDASGLRIQASFPAGIFYGIQSLKQLLKQDKDSFQLPYVHIQDRPRFSWRGYMLDEGRYFQGKELVKKMLDEMALLKMNVFHWHLTEDQGWRLAIDSYPELARVGGRRDSTEIGGWGSNTFDGKLHQGYYTKADIMEVIDYAKARHIQLVPEIEMPGHSSAAIAAYPWLGVSKEPISVPTSFGVKYDVFDVTDPKVIGFLHDVLNEVIALFPGKVIHIGGDEVKFDHWEEARHVQDYMKAHNLSSSSDLQLYFTNGISEYLASKGRRMMGWNDIMGAKLHDYSDSRPVTGTLAPNTIVQFWKGDLDMVKDAVSKGYDVVNSYHVFTYLDYDYKAIPLKKSYEFDPIPEGLDAQYHKKILGSGCQMWGEWTPDEASVYRQTFPRLAAYAEVGWTALDNKDFERFSENLKSLSKRWVANQKK